MSPETNIGKSNIRLARGSTPEIRDKFKCKLPVMTKALLSVVKCRKSF